MGDATPTLVYPEPNSHPERHLKLQVFVRRESDGRGWVPADITAKPIASGQEVEILVASPWRVAIDIKPDRVRPVDDIVWAEVAFGPPRDIPTRHKVAYYRAKRIRRRTLVEFKVRWWCPGCERSDEESFTLIYDSHQ